MDKKGNFNIFGFFFGLLIISGLFLFLSVGLHFILYDFGIKTIVEAGETILNPINATESLTAISNLENSYLGNTKYFDILFAVVILSLFIESVIASALSRKTGFISFFGLLTIGNVFLIYILSYAVQIRGWMLNEIFFQMITVSINTPFMDMFFNYSLYIIIIWYVILIAVRQVDFDPIIERTQNLFSKKSNRGTFEE